MKPQVFYNSCGFPKSQKIVSLIDFGNMLIRAKMSPFGLRFLRNEAKWFDQRVYMPPALDLRSILIKKLSENMKSVFLTRFLYKMLAIYFLIYSLCRGLRWNWEAEVKFP